MSGHLSQLPMNGIDRYFIAQDYPGMHANSHHFIDTEMPLDRAALSRAVRSLLHDVPLARSIVREGPFSARRFALSEWTDVGSLVVPIAAPATDAADPTWEAALDRRFDLRSQPPVRLLVGERQGGGGRVVLTIHHSMGDGTAGMLLLDALVRRYNHASGFGEAPPTIEAPLRRLRDVFRCRGLAWSFRMARRHVRPMEKVGIKNASILDDETPRPSGSRHRILDLPEEAVARLRTSAKRAGRTRNDLLLACALRAADSWRRAREKPDRGFRVLLPTDIRPLLDLPPSLQNFVGVVRSDFSIEDVRSVELSRMVSERVKAGRELEEAVEAPYNLGILGLVLPPWLFRKALRSFDNDPRSFFFSFLWSNIRVPDGLPAPAGAGVTTVWIRGSLPRQPGFGIVLMSGSRSLRIVFEYLPALISDASVESYGQLFTAEISAAGGA